MSFTSFNSYLLHVWHVRSYSKQYFTSTIANRNISKSYQIPTCQIRLIHRLIHLVIVSLNFHFQKCCDPNPRLDPVGGSKPEPGLLRHFNYLLKAFCLILLNFRFQNCRDSNPQLDPVSGSKPKPGLLRHFQLSSQNMLFVLFHFRLFNYAESLHFRQSHKHLQVQETHNIYI